MRTASQFYIALAAALFFAAPVRGQEIIDGGTTVIIPVDHASPWNVGQSIYIGDTSTGALMIAPGAVVNSSDGILGNQTGSNGTVAVVGSGAQWNAGGIVVGNAGQGSLSITAGAIVTNTNTTIAGSAGVTGVAVVSGSGTQWNNSGNTSVGANGNGSLTISDGAVVSSNYSDIGSAAGATGIVTVTGAGSQWNSAAYLYIGKAGNATLNIANGGQVSAAITWLSYFSGATANVSVSGTGSQFSTGDFYVSNSGDPTSVAVSSGGHLISNFAAISSGSSVTITGTNSRWDASSTISNRGTLTIDAGAVVNSTSISSYDGVTTVTGTGSQWTTSGDIEVDGTLNITNGGLVSGGNGYFAESDPTTVTVSGSGSRLALTGDFYAGYGGNATINISNGGVISAPHGIFGQWGNAVVNVSDAGSQLNIGGDLSIGDLDGTATLNVTNGGAVTSVNGYVGTNISGDGNPVTIGIVNVSGAGSQWTLTGDLIVGDGYNYMGYSNNLVAATGTLNISNGGAVSTVTATIGNQSLSLGTITVTGAGSSLTASGALTVGNAGTGTLTIGDGGAVSANSVVIASQSGSVGTLNIGAASGASATGSGTLTTPTIAFGSGTGKLVFNHTDPNYIFSPAISGTGEIDVLSGLTKFTGNSSGFSGSTIISGGKLSVNGTLGGTVAVNNGGTLGGSGTVGTTTVAAGGAISPGNSIGTLTINGNLTMAQGSTYVVETNVGGQSDLIHVTGTAALAGTVNVITSTLDPNKTYTILTANGGITGKFISLVTVQNYNTSNETFSITYDANNVYLKLVPNNVFMVAGTRNQVATGAGIESTGGGTLYNAIRQLDADGARAAFDKVSGEMHSSGKTALIENSHFLRDAANDRLRGSLGAEEDRSFATMSYAESYPEPASGTSQPWDQLRAVPAKRIRPTDGPVAWAKGFGSWSNSITDNNAAALKYSTGGFLVGTDGVWNDVWRVGFMAGYGTSTFSSSDRGSGNSDDFHFGIYAGRLWGNLAWRSSLSYTLSQIRTSRSISFAGFSDSDTARYLAGTFQASSELGYRFDFNPVALEPFANLSYVNTKTQSFTESGGSAALYSLSSTTNPFFTTLGLRGSSSFPTGPTNTTLRASVGWRYAHGDTTPVSTNQFAGGNEFIVAGAPIARNSAVIEAGIDFQLSPMAAFGVIYSTQLAPGTIANSVQVKFSTRF